MINKYTEEFMNKINTVESLKKKKKIIFIFSLVTILTLIIIGVVSIFAETVVDIENRPDGQHLVFNLEHNLTNTKYKYYGYGYTVSVQDTSTKKFLTLKNGQKQYFMSNSEFNPVVNGSTESVDIPIKKIYEILGVDKKYFYHDNLRLWLNARIGIRVNDVLALLYDTLEGQCLNEKGMSYLEEGFYMPIDMNSEGINAPLNSDEYGIKNALYAHYGIDWTEITNKNFESHFGINKDLKAVYAYDGYKIKCINKSTNSIISETDTIDGDTDGYVPITPADKIDELYYTGEYKIDKYVNSVLVNSSTANGKSISLYINKGKSPVVYEISFYYEIPKPDEPDIPDNPEKPVNVNIEYRKDKINGEQLLPAETVEGFFENPFYFNSRKIENMKCTGYYIVDQKKNNVFVEDTSVSIDYLPEGITIVFIYEDTPIVVLPKCTPQFDSICNYVDITMKKSEFEKASVINVMNHDFGIKNVVVGYDQNVKLEGEHKYMYYDFYVYDTKENGVIIEKWDNVSLSTKLSFGVDKSKFNKVTDDLYIAKLTTTYLTFCSCTGVGVNKRYGFDVNVHLIENKPPTAHFNTYTKVEQENGKTRTINEVYIEQQAHIKNNASDPNGIDDIKTIAWTFIDNSTNEAYTINTYRRFGKYNLDSSTIDDCDKIHFAGITDTGDILATFLTDDTWKVTQLVKDTEALQDTFTDTIKPKKLDLRPIAILTDEEEYRFPAGIVLSGKENRIIGFSSKYSEVCNFFKGTYVKIDHEKDYLEIIPLENQDLKSIYFVNNIDTTITDTSIVIENTDFTSQQLMFKQTGKYKLRLKVTDTNGNESDYTEEILTIVEDTPPTAIGSIGNKYYRDKTGTATLTLKNIVPSSIDGDKAIIEKITYKYDSNNDGSFDDEKAKTLKLKDSQVSISTKNLGKYQFVIEVREEFGQPTIDKYIKKSDYKKATVTFVTEVDNIAPQVKEFKIQRAE